MDTIQHTNAIKNEVGRQQTNTHAQNRTLQQTQPTLIGLESSSCKQTMAMSFKTGEAQHSFHIYHCAYVTIFNPHLFDFTLQLPDACAFGFGCSCVPELMDGDGWTGGHGLSGTHLNRINTE